MKRPVATATKAALGMLQPAVAATNRARAGKTTGLNIGWGACRWKKPCYGHARRDRCHKVPGRGKAVNDGPTTALSRGPERVLRGAKCDVSRTWCSALAVMRSIVHAAPLVRDPGPI